MLVMMWLVDVDIGPLDEETCPSGARACLATGLLMRLSLGSFEKRYDRAGGGSRWCGVALSIRATAFTIFVDAPPARTLQPVVVEANIRSKS